MEEPLQFREQMMKDLFGSLLNRQKTVKLGFVHLPHTPGLAAESDKVGDQLALGATLQTSELYRLPFSTLKKTGDEPLRASKGMLDQGLIGDPKVVNYLAKRWGMNSPDTSNAILSWNAAKTKGFTFREGPGPSAFRADEAGFVDVKSLSRAFFTDLNDLVPSTKLEDIVGLVGKTAKPGTTVDFLNRSFQRLGKPVTELNVAQQIQGVFEATYEKAASEGRLPEFKQILNRAGVTGLDVLADTVGSKSDPFGISTILKGISKDSKSYYLSGTRAGASPEEFISRVKNFWGEQYGERFRATVNKLSAAGGENLAFTISETGGIYAGQHGLLDSFQPIYAENVSEDVTKWGFRRGTANVSDRLRLAKQQVVDHKVVPAAEIALSEFEKGVLDPYSGLGRRNIPIALKTGRNRSRKSLSNLLSSPSSRGEVAMTPGFYMSYEAIDSGVMLGRNNAIRDIIFAGSNMTDPEPIWEAYKKATQQALDMRAQGVSPYDWLVKPKDGTVPLEGIEQHLIPGSTSSAMRKKGVQFGKPREITDAERIQRIAASRVERFGEARVQTVGMSMGDFRSYEAGIKATRGAEGKILGRGLVNPITKIPVVSTYIPSAGLGVNQNLFGDAGAILTHSGAELFKDVIRPTTNLKKAFSKQSLEKVFKTLAGSDDLTDTPYADILESLNKNKRYQAPGLGIEINPEQYKNLGKAFKGLPYHAAYLTSADFSSFDDNVTLNFAARGTPTSVSVYHGNQRVSLLNPGKDVLEGTSIFDFSDIISSEESLTSQAYAEKIFGHRTGLAGLSVPSSEGSGPSMFYREYEKAASEMGIKNKLILKKSEDGLEYLIPNTPYEDMDFIPEFEKVSDVALKKMGFTSRQIKGYTTDSPSEKGMASLLGYSDSGITPGARTFIDSLWERAAETDDIMRQQNAFRVRLDLIKRYGSGMESLTGIKPKDNPIFMRMASWWQNKTGFNIDKDFFDTGFITSNSLSVAKDSHFRMITAPLLGDDAVKATGLPVLSRKEAMETFGDLSTSMDLTRGTFLEEQLSNSKLFSSRNRPQHLQKGFYIDLGEEVHVPLLGKVKEPGMPENAAKVKYLPVPAIGKNFAPSLQNLTPGLPKSIGSDTLEYKTLGAISALGNEPGEKGTVKGTLEQYVQGVYREYARTGKSGGFLKKNVLSSASMPGGMRVRPMPKGMTVSEAMESASNLTEKDFTVGISENMARQAFSKMPNRSGYTEKAAQETLDKFLAGEPIWGVAYPNPTHGGGHVNVVKMVFDPMAEDQVTKTGINALHEPRALVGSFLTWRMHRDNDKDTIELMMDPKKYGEADDAAMHEFFQAQIKGASAEYQSYQKELQAAAEKSGKDMLLTDFMKEQKLSHQNTMEYAMKFFSFGKIPAVSYMVEYPTFGFSHELMSDAHPKTIADNLNKLLKNKGNFKKRPIGQSFTESDILKYQKILSDGGIDKKVLMRNVSLFQHNILQAPIQKGGDLAEMLVKDYLGVGYRVKQQIDKLGDAYTPEMAVEEATSSARRFFTKMNEVGKLRYYGPKVATPEQAIETMSQQVGRIYGAMAHMRASIFTPEGLKNASSFPDIYRRATSGPGDLEKITEMFQHEGIDPAKLLKGDSRVSMQDQIAKANEAVKAKAAQVEGKAAEVTSEVAGKSKQWFKKNWKLVAGVGAAVVGLRALSSMFTSDELDRPSLKSSNAFRMRSTTLPPEPMVTQENDNSYINPINMRPPTVRVASPGASYTQTNASYASVNTQDIRDEIATSVYAPNYGSITIQDDRTYRNGWVQDRLASAYENSDFTHPDMGDLY